MPTSPLPSRARLPLPFVLAAALCAALALGTAAPAPASASADGTSARPRPMTEAGVTQLSPEELGARQQPLLDALQRIQDLVGPQTRLGEAGYSGAEISVPRWTVTLYWHGARPTVLTSLIRRLGRTVPVQVVSAGYSERSLLTEARRIAGRLRALRAAGASVTRVGPRADGSGVQVGVDFAASPALARPNGSVQERIAAAARLIASHAPGSVPVTVFDGRSNASAAGNRTSDVSPYKGGARIVRAGNVICSTGFGVVSGNTHYMLFAAHCGGINTSWQVGDSYASSGKAMGLETVRDPSYDTGLIKVDNNQATIYDKGYDSSVTEKVVGSQSVVKGTWTCQNGATSGVICNTVVDDVLQTVSFDNGAFTAQDENVAHNANTKLQSNAGGDSGGPVFVNTGTKGQVKAVGTVSGGYDSVSCAKSDDPNATPACWNHLDFADLNSNLSRWNVHLS